MSCNGIESTDYWCSTIWIQSTWVVSEKCAISKMQMKNKWNRWKVNSLEKFNELDRKLKPGNLWAIIRLHSGGFGLEIDTGNFLRAEDQLFIKHCLNAWWNVAFKISWGYFEVYGNNESFHHMVFSQRTNSLLVTSYNPILTTTISIIHYLRRIQALSVFIRNLGNIVSNFLEKKKALKNLFNAHETMSWVSWNLIKTSWFV